MEKFLRFTDEAEFIAVVTAGQGGGEIIWASHEHVFIAIGQISKPSGVLLIDEDGVEYPEMHVLGGWHCNVECAGDPPDYLTPYLVTPDNPVCVIGK